VASLAEACGTTIVNVEVALVEPGVKVADENVTFDPVGSPVAESVTAPVNGPALVGATVML
jgi:hypothetical protein